MGSGLGVTRLLVILFVLSGCSVKIHSTCLQGLLRFGSTLACLEQQSDLQSRGNSGQSPLRCPSLQGARRGAVEETLCSKERGSLNHCLWNCVCRMCQVQISLCVFVLVSWCPGKVNCWACAELMWIQHCSQVSQPAWWHDSRAGLCAALAEICLQRGLSSPVQSPSGTGWVLLHSILTAFPNSYVGKVRVRGFFAVVFLLFLSPWCSQAVSMKSMFHFRLLAGDTEITCRESAFFFFYHKPWRMCTVRRIPFLFLVLLLNEIAFFKFLSYFFFLLF